MKKILSAVPILRASNLSASIDYYCRVLGFTKDGVYKREPEALDGYAFLSRDGIQVHVSSYGGDGTFGSTVYFYVEAVDALHDEWRAAGAEILYDPAAQIQEPENRPWGMREIYVKDLDGNVLRFGQRS